MSKELIKNLRSIKMQSGQVNPDRVWVAKNRVKLLESVRESAIQMQAEMQPENSPTKLVENFSRVLDIFFSRRVLSFARSGMTVFLVGAVAVSSWIASVSASSDSLPGEIMYNVKMANESTELLVANMIGSDKDKVSTILKHASQRVNEYQRSGSEKQATKAIESLKKKIESSSKSLDEAEKKSPKDAVAVAKVIEEKTEEILVSLSEEESITGKKLQEDVAGVEGLIQDASIKAMEMIVKKVEQKEVGEDVITADEVKKTITKRLDQLVSDVSKIEKTNNVSSSTINTVKLETVSSTELAIDMALLSSTTNTAMAPTSTMTEASLKVDEATKMVSETNQIVEVGKMTVTGLIEQNDLSGALSKLKELSGVKNETQIVVTEASNAVNQVVQDEKDVIAPTFVPIIPIISPSSTLNTLIAPSSTTGMIAPSPVLASSTIGEIKIGQ